MLGLLHLLGSMATQRMALSLLWLFNSMETYSVEEMGHMLKLRGGSGSVVFGIWRYNGRDCNLFAPRFSKVRTLMEHDGITATVDVGMVSYMYTR